MFQRCHTFVYTIRESHWRCRATEGAEFWIGCKRLKLLRNSKFSALCCLAASMWHLNYCDINSSWKRKIYEPIVRKHSFGPFLDSRHVTTRAIADWLKKLSIYGLVYASPFCNWPHKDFPYIHIVVCRLTNVFKFHVLRL